MFRITEGVVMVVSHKIVMIVSLAISLGFEKPEINVKEFAG